VQNALLSLLRLPNHLDLAHPPALTLPPRHIPPWAQVLELREACRLPTLSSRLLVVIAPQLSDIALCQQLAVETWVGGAVVLVNAGFLTASPDALRLPAGELAMFAEQVGCWIRGGREGWTRAGTCIAAIFYANSHSLCCGSRTGRSPLFTA
jgi:hypothetical protein